MAGPKVHTALRASGPALAVVLALVWWTNSAPHLTRPSDVEAYLRIANASPDLPRTLIQYHYAQRFAVPYALGLVAKSLATPSETLFRYLSYTCLLSIIILTAYIVSIFVPCNTLSFLLVCLYVLNPYLLRYYLTFPGMFTDVLFVLGLCLVILGFIHKRDIALNAGLVIASIARQTALLFIPALIYTMVQNTGDKASASRRRHIARGLVQIGLLVCIYRLTGLVGAQFATAPRNLELVTGLVREIQVGIPFNVAADFFGRVILMFGLPLAVVVGFLSVRRNARKHGGPVLAQKDRDIVLLMFLLATPIIAQPILAGPAITGDGVQRLVGLGFVPVLVMAAIVVGNCGRDWKPGLRFGMSMGALMFAGSLHHTYTFLGEQRAQKGAFAILCIGVCVAVYLLIWWESSVAAEERLLK